MRLALTLSLALASGVGATAAGWREALAPPAGARILLDEAPLPGRYAAPVRTAAPGVSPVSPVEGRVGRIAFAVEGGGSTYALARAWRARLEALGFRTLLDCGGAECGGFDFRMALDLALPPDMIVNLADFRQLTAQGPAENGEALVSALLSRLGDRLHGQVVVVELGAAVAEARASDAPDRSEAPARRPLDAPAAPPAELPAPPAPLRDIGARLDAEGHVALDGLDFLPGSALLADSAGPLLDAAAAALAARPGLAVAIVGHTDASGARDVNLAVSRARAEAVRAALVARGIAAERLSAEGVGWLAPRASDATEAGRAANRRVELVARRGPGR